MWPGVGTASWEELFAVPVILVIGFLLHPETMIVCCQVLKSSTQIRIVAMLDHLEQSTASAEVNCHW